MNNTQEPSIKPSLHFPTAGSTQPQQQQYGTPNNESHINYYNLDNYTNDVLPPAYDEVFNVLLVQQASAPVTAATSHIRQRIVLNPNIVNSGCHLRDGYYVSSEHFQEPHNVNEYHDSSSMISRFNHQINIYDHEHGDERFSSERQRSGSLSLSLGQGAGLSRQVNSENDGVLISLSSSRSTLSIPTSRKEIKQTRKDCEKHAKMLRKLERWHKKEEKLHRRGEKKMDKGDKDGEKILRKEEKMRGKIVKLEAKVDKEFEKRRL